MKYKEHFFNKERNENITAKKEDIKNERKVWSQVLCHFILCWKEEVKKKNELTSVVWSGAFVEISELIADDACESPFGIFIPNDKFDVKIWLLLLNFQSIEGIWFVVGVLVVMVSIVARFSSVVDGEILEKKLKGNTNLIRKPRLSLWISNLFFYLMM